MNWRHRGVEIPIEVYHGVPSGWTPEQILYQHKILRGSFPIDAPEPTEFGAPSWMTERARWLRYRQILYNVAAGVRAGDRACIEIAVRYIIFSYIGSYSGFVRSKLARALKGAPLTANQKHRLDAHFSRIVAERDYTQEFYEYRKLWTRLRADRGTTTK